MQECDVVHRRTLHTVSGPNEWRRGGVCDRTDHWMGDQPKDIYIVLHSVVRARMQMHNWFTCLRFFVHWIVSFRFCDGEKVNKCVYTLFEHIVIGFRSPIFFILFLLMPWQLQIQFISFYFTFFLCDRKRKRLCVWAASALFSRWVEKYDFYRFLFEGGWAHPSN